MVSVSLSVSMPQHPSEYNTCFTSDNNMNKNELGSSQLISLHAHEIRRYITHNSNLFEHLLLIFNDFFLGIYVQ
ncbi:hypothetical protein J2Z65_007051 [Paenibacillus aceris]|uniref:Uncharacterized protein n=1 Tax=Paenibacillus aceris TaxID=869555 RepID=A0ABS4IA05_9BACL|nr:hypothetical protein [Paenibacillus aceris]